jgi:hypothetical protein
MTFEIIKCQWCLPMFLSNFSNYGKNKFKLRFRSIWPYVVKKRITGSEWVKERERERERKRERERGERGGERVWERESVCKREREREREREIENERGR